MSVVLAAVVTAIMVTTDVLTRDSVPTPSERVEVDVRSATLQFASTPARLRRQRARLTVGVRVTNVSGRRLALGQPTLRAGDANVRPDRNVNDGTDALRNPVARGAVAEGELRFETAGKATLQLATGRGIRLHIADQSVPLQPRAGIGPRPTPAVPPTERLDVDVRSATLLLAKTPSGLRRRRARLAVRVRVTNVGRRRRTLGQFTLLAGAAEIRPDVNARDSAGALLKPVGRGAVAEGELRFETAGKATQHLTMGRPTRLRIAGQTVPVTPQPVKGG